ncbi:MAG: hotdog fold thioesterase, partial [Flavobacteriaceae bacterium]|nr:hotdog fold thioesterase [Flavobacteriaceae bacterium]
MDAETIVKNMYENDAFSQWLGISVDAISPGYCRLSMKVKDSMLNGFGLAHGGITYSLADSALAFASNSRGRHAVSVETSINHLEKLKSGDAVFAEATEVSLRNTIGLYRVEIKSNSKLV